MFYVPHYQVFSLTKYTCWTSSEMIAALKFLVDDIYVRFDNMVCQQIFGIPRGMNFAPFIADFIFLCCYESVYDRNSERHFKTGFRGQV